MPSGELAMRVMLHLWNDLMRVIDRMTIQQWLVVLIVAMILGILCMRGYGSRSAG